MERVEHNTTIGNSVIDEYGIEDFRVFSFWLRIFYIGQHVTSKHDIETFASA